MYNDAMIEKLAKAFEQASRLPEADQDELAQAILDELASDQRWDELFSRSQDAFKAMADEALADYRSGRTEPMDGKS